MRRLPLLVSGLLLLPLGALPAAASTTADPAPSASASATADPEPSETATPAPTPTPTPSATATDPGDDEPEYPDLDGTFTRTPASGKAGTTVTVESVDRCVDDAGTVAPTADVVAVPIPDLDEDLDLGDLEDLDALVVEKTVDTGDDGSWSTALKIPAKAKPGYLFMIVAACFAKGVDPTDEDAVPTRIYEPQDFTVTGAPKAPVADPVPGDPRFTG